MSDAPHVVAVCGSLREASRTRRALAEALDGAREAGATTDLLDLREFELPMYDPDVDDQGDGPDLRARIRDADAVILGTPMYHGSYSNAVKNALDYCGFDEFEGKTVGLLAVSGGSFPVTALEHLRSVCRALDAWVLPHQAAVPRASSAIDADGTFADEGLAERVRVLGRRAVQYAGIEPDPASFESEHNEGA
jgi:NAD(P)H-dependent FMN reductase